MFISKLQNVFNENSKLSKHELKKVWKFSALFFALLAMVYLLKGYYHLLFDPIGAGDFIGRWKAQQYLYQGHYPFPVIGFRSPYYDPNIGKANFGGYFSWSYFSSILLIPPFSLEIDKIYYSVLNLLAILVLGIFAYRTGAKYGQWHGFFGVASVLAISANCTTLGLGQYGIILNAVLILFLQCLKKDKSTLAGLLGGFSLLKPNITALYVLVLFARKNYWAAAVATFYTALASLLIAIVVSRNPLSLIVLPFQRAFKFAASGDSFVNIFTSIGLSVQWTVYFLLVVGVIITFFILRGIGQITLEEQFAVASVVGRLWTYHGIYDNTMLLFLYIAILELTFRQPNSPNFFMLYLLGLSLWIPAGWVDTMPMQATQYAIWIGNLIFLLTRRTDQTPAYSAHL